MSSLTSGLGNILKHAPSTPTLVVNAILIGLVLYVYNKIRARQRNPSGYPLPPGPKPSPIPFIGNIPDMPSSQEWLTFTNWGKKYGPLVMVEILGQKMCIINTHKAATDLLDARSQIYSDRPAMPMINDLMGWDFNMGLQPYGPMYKKHRTVFQRGFNARTSDTYQPIQTKEITLLLQKLVQSPTKYDDHLRVTTGAIIFMIAFGYSIRGSSDPFVRVAEEAQLAMVSAARPGAYLVDVLPILKYVPEWFPGAGFKRIAREGRELAEEMQEKPWAWAMKQWEEGNALPSFFTTLMESRGTTSDDPVEEAKILQCASAVMYATGADTILSSILTFVLAMVHHPEVQKQAQEELDRVVGNDRLPTFADREALPYVTAVAKEALRWESVIPLGVPHRVTQDDVYEGYFIPAGTTMIPNQWGISHDDSMYPDPMAFDPTRFLKPSASIRDPNTIAFGWGRRICPGRFLAENSLWLHVAAMLSCFDIKRSIGPDGKEIVPARTYTTGMASRPAPFPCEIVPRSAKAVEIIELSVAELK